MQRLLPFHLIGFAFFLLPAANVSAQVPVALGIRGGINFANASIEPEFSTSSRTGFMIGGVVEVGLSGPIYLQIEPMYTQKGAELNLTLFGETLTSTGKFDYLEIPVTLKAKFGTTELKPYIFAGPNLGFNLSAEAEVEVGGLSETTDVDEFTESIDFAIDFGGGIEFKVAPRTSLIADIRYALGLSDIDKDAVDSWKSRDVKILVGVMFGL